ncbi:MAG TPA: tRNA pseudouridine(38-40) synthase TruA [Candidatus Thermoplasmatota archaeon]|nr:tRNA pseudouridine(38-40) synthase TruA [Candidatus Thermoplasmatota archaeon]
MEAEPGREAPGPGAEGVTAEEIPVAFRLAYDGRRFDSYARDPGASTVEGHLIAALRLEGYVEGTFRTGSRTDAGVSALENVCKATVRRPHLRGLVPALQRNLPEGLWVTAAARVVPHWNPRHARRRHYRYHAVPRTEGLALMRQACALFVGRHDMRAFAKLEEGRDPERNVFAFTVGEEGGMWVFRVEGDGFLWNQVRRMVSAVLCVGRGEAPLEAIAHGLAAGNAHPRFRLVSANGLVLERIEYDSLRWDPEAGRVGPHSIGHHVQDAHAGMLLARHLRELAPWPTAAPSAEGTGNAG